MAISGMHRSAALTAVAALAALNLTACGSGGSAGSAGSGGSGGSGGRASATPPSTAATTSSGGATAGAAATAAIKTAYAKFFAPDTPGNVSLGLLQNGQAFKATIAKQTQGAMAANSSAKVTKVTLLSPDTAKVLFTIYVSNKPMLNNQDGYAVREGGTWKVSEYTFCGLLTLEATAPAACKQPAGSQPPH